MDGDSSPLSQMFQPLSQRERAVLALLAENLSNREIADRLVLALTTVKWYNQQIFNKLSVENRQQAVERARSVGLLEGLEPVAATSHNLPVQLTPFIGRISELDDVSRLLQHPNTRLVTILAPGGMGKTRLALTVAEAALPQFEGICFVPLAPLTSTDQLVPTIGEHIGLQFFPDSRVPRQQLLDFLRDKHLLLVLDNFEHLLEETALVTDLLQAAPQVKVLVTSRERLHIDAETVYRLGGMPCPEAPDRENALDYGAIQLFVECAHRASPQLADHDLTSVVHICQLVQGMPLAIELAAAWMGTLSPLEIADEITRSIDFLQTTMRNAPDRLRSIRAVFEATWRRLTGDEQQAFRRLSVFRDGCTREAAHQIASADLRTLAGLADKALLWHHPKRGRYEIHELLRQYATEQLEASGEAEQIQTAHRDYFGMLAQAWGKALKTSKQLQALDILETDFDNLREAFQRAIETGKPEVVEPFTDLWYFYEIRERNAEGMKIFGLAIEALRGKDSIALGKLFVGQAIFHERFYQYDHERRLAQEGVAILRRLGADSELAFPLTALGVGIKGGGDMDGGMVIHREAYEIAQRYDDQWVQAILFVCFGGYAQFQKQPDEAKNFLLQAYALSQRLDNQWIVAFILRDLGYLAYREGDYEEAKRLFETGLASARKLHHLTTVCHALGGLCRVAVAQGALVQARHYAEEALKIERSLGNRTGIYWRLIELAEVAIVTESHQDAREQLHKALQMFDSFVEPELMVSFGIIASEFLAQTESETHAVLLISFLFHQSKREWLSETEELRLQKLAARLQTRLSADNYATAWTQGQTLALADLVTLLQSLI